MTSKKCILLFVFVAITIKADFSLSDWKYKKRIAISDVEGVASVKVDAEVYNNSRQDFHDIRVVSYAGEEIPYKLKLVESKKEIVYLEPKLYNVSHKPDAYTELPRHG